MKNAEGEGQWESNPPRHLMSNDKPLFSWQVFNRDAGFADQVTRQPHAPWQVLIMNMSETIEVPHPAGAAYYLA